MKQTSPQSGRQLMVFIEIRSVARFTGSHKSTNSFLGLTSQALCCRLLRRLEEEHTMSMDLALEAWVSGLIELSKYKWMLGAGRRWQPGDKMKLFFTGYTGKRNKGAEVCVEEIQGQLKQ